jgi:hypothetical protein
MAAPPTPDELGPLLAETNDLDAPLEDAEESEGGEFEAAAMTAVGTRAKASALRDAIEAYCREKGLLESAQEGENDELPDEAEADDIGSGFEDY